MVEYLKSNVLKVFENGSFYILKKSPKKNSFSFLYQFFTEYKFKNELMFYENCKNQNLVVSFLPYSEVNMKQGVIKIEYVNSVRDVVNIFEYLDEYYKFQKISFEVGYFRKILNNFIIGFFNKILLIHFVNNLKYVGVTNCLRVYYLYIKLNLSQKKLKRSFLLHGDFYQVNMFVTEENKIKFIDFEYVFSTRKWPLFEIVIKCFNWESGSFNKIKFDEYLRKFEKEIICEINEVSQIRFGLLRACVYGISHTKIRDKRSFYMNFLNIILDDNKFENWYHQLVSNV